MCLVQLFITIKTPTWYHSHPLGYDENQHPIFLKTQTITKEKTPHVVT